MQKTVKRYYHRYHMQWPLEIIVGEIFKYMENVKLKKQEKTLWYVFNFVLRKVEEEFF